VTNTKVFEGVEFSRAAYESILECCGGRASEVPAMISADVEVLRSGGTPAVMLADLLNGAASDRVEGWREYWHAVCAAAGVPSDLAVWRAMTSTTRYAFRCSPGRRGRRNALRGG
jgi:hypothetical protein